jgi:hypothetical protein
MWFLSNSKGVLFLSLGVSNLIQTPSVDRRIFLIWKQIPGGSPDVVLHPDVAPFADNRFNCCALLQRNIINDGTDKASGIGSSYFMQTRLTPEYWFEKAERYFRRSRTNSNLRVELEALGNTFMVKAVELDVKQQNLAKGNYSAALPAS